MTRPTSPTLEDVARASGVSTATISRVINSPDKVAQNTRDKVQAAIDFMGYTPNFAGKSLASNRSNTIGAVIPSMANAMFASGLQAFQDVLYEEGVTLLVASSNYDSEREFTQIKSLITQGADGLLLIGSERPQKTKNFLKLRQIPTLISWSFQDNSPDHFVGFDNEKAAFQMAQAVLAQGHTKIAMISAPAHDNDRAAARITGVAKAIQEHPTASLETVIEAPYLIANGSDAFDKIWNTCKPTVIICGNDVLAAGALIRAKDRGLNIPKDLSITGFDDIGLAVACDPQLTTIRVPQEAMGRQAAKTLLAKIKGEPTQSQELQATLITRGSLGPSMFPKYSKN